MRRISGQERIKLWLDRLSRYYRNGQSAAEFCVSEGVSLPSFYQWKRRLSPTIGSRQTTCKKRTGSTTSSHQTTSSPQANFTELAVATRSSAASCIRLAGNVVIELGTEQATVTTIVNQVLDRCLPATGESSSC